MSYSLDDLHVIFQQKTTTISKSFKQKTNDLQLENILSEKIWSEKMWPQAVTDLQIEGKRRINTKIFRVFPAAKRLNT